MQILTVPNWSFGRQPTLLRQFGQVLERSPVTAHYLKGDRDHNRTVSAFSGSPEAVEQTLFELCELAFPKINLARHHGVHPRVGALDVCPFVSLEGPPLEALASVERFAQRLASRFELPVFLYEKSERGRHESELPSLRRGGFEALDGVHLEPDFGPHLAHPKLGITVTGVRDFLIAWNINLETNDTLLAKSIAREIRDKRAEGELGFLGVRALGFPLASKEVVQVSMNLTLPDATPIDPIVEWVRERAANSGVRIRSTELVGVIRARDLPRATQIRIRPQQIIAL